MTTSKGRRRRISGTLAKIAGGRQEVLDKAPAGRGRQAAMGGVIVTTSVLAAASATFAVHMAVRAPIWVAVLLGLGWGVVIFNIDRMLVLGIGHERSWTRNLWMAAPRVVLAFILGVVISTPLTLQIFDREIQAQLLVQQQNRRESYDKQLTGLTDQINAAQARIAKDQALANGGAQVDPAKDPRVVAAQQTSDRQLAYFTAQQAKYLDLAHRAQCEFDGSCGTHVSGDGPQYRTAKALADQQSAVVKTAQQALDTANQQLASAQQAARASATTNSDKARRDAQADLTATQLSYQRLTDQKAALQKGFGDANAHDTGLLSRLEALDQLAGQHFTLRAAQLMLAALFLCIEILPVLMKMLLNIGPETAYERVAQEMDDGDLAAFRNERTLQAAAETAEIEAAKVRLTLVVSNEQDRVDRQREILKDINLAVTAEQKRVVLAALGIWSEHAQRESKRVLAEYERQVNSAATPPQQAPVPPPNQQPAIQQPPAWGAPTQYGQAGWAAPTQQCPTQTPSPTNGHNHPSQLGDLADFATQQQDSPYVQGMDLPKPEDL